MVSGIALEVLVFFFLFFCLIPFCFVVFLGFIAEVLETIRSIVAISWHQSQKQ